MPSMQLRRDDVIVGVDTHKDQHVAVLLDGSAAGSLSRSSRPPWPVSIDWLLYAWRVGPDGRLASFGVGGTGSYGIGLARFLRRHRYTVQEVHRPPREGERRMSGKSKPSTPSTPAAKCSPARGWPSRRPLTARLRRSGCALIWSPVSPSRTPTPPCGTCCDPWHAAG